MSILCTGDLCCDLIVPYGKMKAVQAAGDFGSAAAAQMHVKMQCGGSVANTARTLGVLGAKPLFITPLKEDALGLYLREEMEKSGVDMSLAAPSEKSNMYCIAVLDERGERTMFCFLPPWADYPRFHEDSFRGAPSASPGSLTFTGGMAFLNDAANNSAVLDFIAKRRAEGSRIVFDLNIRAESYGYEGVRRDSIEKMIRQSDIVLGSGQDEFSAVTGESSLSRAAQALLKDCRGTVIARDGGNPILVAGRGAEEENGLHRAEVLIPVKPVRVLSTLGAGDVFDAMFLKKLEEGSSICRAVRMASDYAGAFVSGA